jgi:hypothetical protein
MQRVNSAILSCMSRTAQLPQSAKRAAGSAAPHLPPFSRLSAGTTSFARSLGLLLTFSVLSAADPMPGGGSAPQIVAPEKAAADVWFRIEYDDAPVGYEHLSSQRVNQTATGGTPDRISRFRETEIKLTRFGRDLSVASKVSTLETTDGRLLEWTLQRTAGDGTKMRRSGTWSPQRSCYDVEEVVQATRTSTQLQSTTQPWSPLIAAWGPQLLSQTKSSIRRSVLFPETNAIVNIRFERKSPHSLRLRSGAQITVTPLVFQPSSDPQLTTRLYIASDGTVVRSEQSLLGQSLIMERAEPTAALAAAGKGGVDIDAQSLVPVNRQITNLKQRLTTRLQVYPGQGGAVTIPESDWQSVELQSDGSSIVTLTRPQVPRRQSAPAARRPGANLQYLQQTDILNFETHAVRTITLRAAGAVDTDYDQCVRMTRYLSTNLRRSRFSTSMLPADQVAKSMRGDCTEHAVLLAAMMRARGIPARVATGLIYVERVSAFTAHMWTEALIGDVWIPFDSATGDHKAAADRIKLLDSAMDFPPSGAVSLFLPLLPLLDETKIKVLQDTP